MKTNKIVLMLSAVLLMVVANSVHAQRPVGDTLQCPSMDTTYYYYNDDWPVTFEADDDYHSTSMDLGLRYLATYRGAHWPAVNYYAPYTPGANDLMNLQMNELLFGNKIVGNHMVADRPLKVLGIAACGRMQPVADTTLHNHLGQLVDDLVHFPNTVDTTLAGRATDSVHLYKITPEGPQYLTGGPWRVEYPHRYIILPAGDSLNVRDSVTGEWYTIRSVPPIVPLYEVMFDKPQVVSDSFMVAGTCNNNELTEEMRTQTWPREGGWPYYMWLWERCPTRYWQVWSGSMGHPYRFVRDTSYVTWIKFRQESWRRICMGDRLIPLENVHKHFYVIYPIIDPDFDTTLCDAVRDVRQVSATDTTLTLMWNGGNNVQWEVQYAEVNGWDAWTVTTTVPMVTLTGLREQTNYLVRVRGMCEWDTEYGPWSELVDVYTGAHHDDPPDPPDPPDPLSVSNLDRFTQMMPNPASGQVSVLSSYRLSRVVVYDLAGHAVLEQEDDGLTTTFDVSGLAKGVYVVAIHTPAGIATKRLVVIEGK